MKAILGSFGVGAILLGLALAIMASAGCAMIRVSTEGYTVTGISMFKSVEIPKIVKSADGSVTVEGYKGMVEVEELEDISLKLLKMAAGAK